MLANYVKIAFKVFLRRKFFTLISLFGISFTLVVLMVACAILDNVCAPYPPEVNQDRSLYVTRARMYGEHAGWMTAKKFALVFHPIRLVTHVRQRVTEVEVAPVIRGPVLRDAGQINEHVT